jgi:hypothetical protein
MIINYFNIQGLSIGPSETDSELVIDPNAMLADAIAFQGLKLVSKWDAQIIQTGSRIDLIQLAKRNLPKITGQTPP